MIDGYILVKRESPGGLSSEVNYLITQGYQPLGPAQVVPVLGTGGVCHYCQTMVREKK